MLYAVNDDNTDQNAGWVETPTATDDNDKLIIISHVNQLCFSTYIAASYTKPKCVADFKAYLSVIIKSSRHFQDFASALYDWQFR